MGGHGEVEVPLHLPDFQLQNGRRSGIALSLSLPTFPPSPESVWESQPEGASLFLSLPPLLSLSLSLSLYLSFSSPISPNPAAGSAHKGLRNFLPVDFSWEHLLLLVTSAQSTSRTPPPAGVCVVSPESHTGSLGFL